MFELLQKRKRRESLPAANTGTYSPLQEDPRLSVEITGIVSKNCVSAQVPGDRDCCRITNGGWLCRNRSWIRHEGWLARGWNVVVGWLGKWLWSSFIVVEKQLDGRGGKADEGKSGRGKERTRERADEKKKARQNCRALFHGISPDCQPRRSSPPVEPIDSSELTRSPPSADVSPVSSWRLGSPRSSSSSFSSPGRPDAGMP